MSTIIIPANAHLVAYNGGFQVVSGQQSATPSPVTVTDTDDTEHEVPAGGSYTCTIPPPTPIDVVKTFSFGASSSITYEIPRFGFDCTVDLDDYGSTNLDSVDFSINGSSVGGVQTIHAGDAFLMVISRLAAGIATITLTFNPINDTETISTPDGYYVTWTNLVNMSVDSTTYLASIRALVAAVNGTDLFDKGAHSLQNFAGQFSVEIDALTFGSVFGISLDNSSAPNLVRAKYSWYCAGNGLLQVFANGGFIDAFFVPRNNAMIYGLRIVDTGTSIEFWYKPPSGVWTLQTTTTSGYSGGTIYYASIVSSVDGQRTRGVRLNR